jgi:aerobic-type carbon monoxide dehydrogenase small subunit (CoxS/CutS family)
VALDLLIDCDGVRRSVSLDDEAMPLLYALTDLLELDNPRYGCGVGQCGACIVHVNGRPVRSCVTPAASVAGKKVVTLAGLGSPERPHPLQTAFIGHQATQCGYCLNGWMMTAASLLRDKPHASREEIRKGLARLVCRCGAHMSILRAIEDAAGAGP